MKKKIPVWFYAFTKRLFLKRFFILLLCLFPLMAIGLRLYSSQKTPFVEVALYNEGNTTLAKDTIDALKELNSIISFYETDSKEQLYKDVKKTKAECGYIFTDQFIHEHILDDKKRQDTITLVQSPSSLLSGSMNELIFAAYFKLHNEELLLDYIKQPGILAINENLPEVVSQASIYFEQYAHSDAIIQPKAPDNTLSALSKEQLTDSARTVKETYLSDLGRGILSLFILLGALCGAFQIHTDRQNGLFAPFTPFHSKIMQLLGIATPAILIGAAGLIGLAILPAHESIIKEAIGLFFYIPTASLTAYLLCTITKGGSLFHITIPFTTLGAMIFAPVFMDFSAYAKALTIPKYLFVNTYYLEMITGSLNEFLTLVLVFIILTVISLLLRPSEALR